MSALRPFLLQSLCLHLSSVTVRKARLPTKCEAGTWGHRARSPHERGKLGPKTAATLPCPVPVRGSSPPEKEDGRKYKVSLR